MCAAGDLKAPIATAAIISIPIGGLHAVSWKLKVERRIGAVADWPILNAAAEHCQRASGSFHHGGGVPVTVIHYMRARFQSPTTTSAKRLNRVLTTIG